TGLAALLGLCAYALEHRLRPESVHASFPRRVGFAPYAVDARACESPEELADLVLASSATPPITPIGRFRDAHYLDGGFVDNAPGSSRRGSTASRATSCSSRACIRAFRRTRRRRGF